MSIAVHTGRLTLKSLQAIRARNEKLTMLTAYDAVTAHIADEAGIEMLLVGDSLGNVVLGYETTIPVRLDDMILHTAAVVRGSKRALVICDLPFGTYSNPEMACTTAVRVFQQTGCQAVKLEGGLWARPVIHKLVEQGIPVVAHIGLTPQSVHQLGGFYRHGKTSTDADRLFDEALALSQAGAFAVVLECVTPEVAARITREIPSATIGIGSGPDCSGQVLVINDLIGLSVKPAPSFAKARADVAGVIRKAVLEYCADVKSGGNHT